MHTVYVQVLSEARSRIRALRVGVTDSWESPSVMWVLGTLPRFLPMQQLTVLFKSSPRGEPVILTSEPFLQLLG